MRRSLTQLVDTWRLQHTVLLRNAPIRGGTNRSLSAQERWLAASHRRFADRSLLTCGSFLGRLLLRASPSEDVHDAVIPFMTRVLVELTFRRPERGLISGERDRGGPRPHEHRR